jgi:hypothetical protein
MHYIQDFTKVTYDEWQLKPSDMTLHFDVALPKSLTTYTDVACMPMVEW